MDKPELNPEFIQRRLEGYSYSYQNRTDDRITIQEEKVLRRAAVLMPLFINQDSWHLLFIHRSNTIEEHQGQVAFPGGVKDRDDGSLWATALREAQEEIGLDPGDVTLFGRLEDHPVITGYVVRPFVGMIPWPYDLRISNEEVETVFSIPLSWLQKSEHREERQRQYEGRDINVTYFQPYQGHLLWGASAEMTLTLLSVLGLI